MVIIRPTMVMGPTYRSQNALSYEHSNHTLNVKPCLEAKGFLQTLIPSLCSRPLFLSRIFPRRLRTFGEGPALFTMYKSEGPISKTSEAPRSNAGVAPPTAKKAEEGPGVPSTCRHGDGESQSFSIEPACVGPVTPVCPPFPQVCCRPQRDLFGRSGRPGTFLRTTSTRIRGNSGKRHGGSNRQPCSCHASRHPTGRHPSLTHPLWVPRACWTGPFGRRSSRWWPPRRTSRIRWSRELVLVRGRA